MLKINSTKWSLDNRIYGSNDQNSDFDDLNFDGEERFISRRQLYGINDNIEFRLISGLSVDV